MVSVVDKEMLLGWLRAQAKRRHVLIGAIYEGLAQRVARGDFDAPGGVLS